MGWARSRLWAVRKDGRRVPVEISLSPLTVEGGPPIVIAALRDVSARLAIEEERARLEDQLRHAQKMESIGTLASGIAHDFNNLLAIAAINLELLRSQLPPSAAALAPIDDIAVAHRRAADLVKQILAFGRRQPSQRVRVSLTALVHEATRLMRATLPATVTLRADVEPMPELLVDATQIHQVLMNLATNAWHALAGNPGHIDIEGRLVVLDEETQPAPGMSTGAYARLDVRDDGTGMTEATRARVFEPFFSTKGVGGGSGLGLSVAHGVVTAHGGAITVQSTLGGGTTFSVFLPLAPLDAEAEDGRETPPMLRRPTLDARVLLVDDELSLTRATRGMLEQLGCTVTSHVRSHDALADLRLDPARFDVVITDQHMPEIGGLDLARALEAIRPDLPVILVSGNQSMVADREVGPNVRTRLEKPYTMHALRETIAKVMDTRAHG
jgi:signal transduction histidine kinase